MDKNLKESYLMNRKTTDMAIDRFAINFGVRMIDHFNLSLRLRHAQMPITCPALGWVSHYWGNDMSMDRMKKYQLRHQYAEPVPHE